MEITRFTYQSNLLPQVADLYDVVFTASPWFDPPLGRPAAIEYIEAEIRKPYAVALLALVNEEPIGFAWGYRSYGFPLSKYETLPGQEYIARVVPMYTYFYISEVGVNFDFRGQSIGNELTTRLAGRRKKLLMRTLDVSPMLSIALRRLGMKPIVGLQTTATDPENPNRVILMKL